jgi:hypothetical protein
MKKLTNDQMVNMSGGVCQQPPTSNPNFPFACLNHCLIAMIMSNGNAAFEVCPL